MFIERNKVMKSLSESKSSTLFFSSKKEQTHWFECIKEKTSYNSILTEIREEAERLLQNPMKELTFQEFTIFRETGSRLEYEKSYFAKRRRLNTFALMTLLEPTESVYLRELQETIWSICNEYTWCLPAHLKNSPEMDGELKDTFLQTIKNPRYSIDLFAAETAFALSEISHILDHVLDPLIQKRVKQEVYRRVLEPFQHQSFEWEKSTHNWAAVCAGSIGAAALYVVNDHHMLSSILDRVLQAMSYYLIGFNEDGACMEGYGYWQYGFGFYVYFSDLLKINTCGEIDLFQIEKVHQIATFQQKCFIYKNQVVNFSDSTEKGSVFLGLSHYLKDVFPKLEVPETELRAAYTDDHCSRWAPAFRNLIWFDENKSGKPWGNATYYLKDSQWFISRHNEYVFASKGGHNDEPHNHNDVGHFILQAKGETFLKDLGSGMYCEGYFNQERYTFLCNGSQGHSVPIINHQFQSEGASCHASAIHFVTSQEDDVLEMDLAGAYEVGNLERLSRKFIWKKKNIPEMILSDTYSFTERPTSIVERFITPVMKVTEESDGVVLEGTEKMKILFDRDKLDLTIQRNEFLNHLGEREEFYQLDFAVKELREVTRLDFRFVFGD
ncbi:heparinase II/III family protein [Metabacillus schmidteae]|uniref:heparinase II/III family protein n=1 Tax=Metabacillus schmidteae TaxID=2730405 RepID=UPI00158AED2C|nr:heparinase II/III family protein [Metabacillus schmidteae]